MLRLSILALVALWLPTTLHCRLEAAGLLTPQDECSQGHSGHATTDCKDDACSTVEDALYKESGKALQVPSLGLLACTSFLYLQICHPVELSEPALTSVEAQNRPRDWVASWHFVRRAAPPSRAPSILIG